MNLGSWLSDSPLNDVFSGHNGATTQDYTATATTMPLTTEHVVSSATYDLTNNEVTINETGTYEVTYSASAIVSTGSSRSQGQSWLERNGTEVAGTRVYQYCRLANNGATGSAQVYVSITAGDTLRVRSQRTTGAGTLRAPANSIRLALRRL